MWMLAITLYLLVGGHHRLERTTRLAYPTQFTCQEAASLIDRKAVLAAADRRYRGRRARTAVERLGVDCEAATDGRDVPSWTYGNRMHLS